MASADLMKLYQLHLIDVGILEVRKKAASLEAGKKIQAELEAYAKHVKEVENAFHKIHGEQKDLELSNQQIDDKIKLIEKHLFDGTVTSAKEVEAYESQVKTLKKQKEGNEDRLLTVWDEVATAETGLKKEQKALSERTTSFEEWKAKAVTFKSQLEAKFKDLSAKRPVVAKTIDPGLLNRYEGIKSGHQGVGMALITRQQTCEVCGTKVSDKSIETIKDDRVVTCEECQRILYWTGGVI